MRMTKTFILLVAALSAPAYAVTDQERSALQRLNTELEAITKIIDEAQQAANPHDRKLVDYQRLRADLHESFTLQLIQRFHDHCSNKGQ